MRISQKILMFNLLLVSFSSMTFANPIYSGSSTYFNPVSRSTQDCGDFYRVIRPIMPMVNHIFIVMRYQDQNFIYGATKGESDLNYARQIRFSEPSASFSFVTRKCGEDLFSSAERATQLSLRWEQAISNSFYFVARMLTTPVFGRICHMAAQNIIQEITSEAPSESPEASLPSLIESDIN